MLVDGTIETPFPETARGRRFRTLRGLLSLEEFLQVDPLALSLCE